MSASFFMSFEFKTRASGFSGTLSGNKIYSIDYFEDVEKLIADALRVLKTGDGAQVTFEHFDGFSKTALCRIFTGYDGDAATFITWRRSAYGYETFSGEEAIQVTKKAVKKCVLRAVDLFREREAEVA